MHLIVLQLKRSGRPQSFGGKHWWLVILLRLVAVLGMYVGVSSYVPFPLYILITIALILGSGIAFYFDKQYVRTHSSWTPSAWHYLILLPTVGEVVGVVYLYKRYRHIGLSV